MHSGACLIVVLLLASTPAWAQSAAVDANADLEVQPLPPSPPAGQTAETAAGRVGERRTREQVEGVEPMARISNRIQNRVQTRIRNRIDRNYDPNANATSPFVVAGEAAQRPDRRLRR